MGEDAAPSLGDLPADLIVQIAEHLSCANELSAVASLSSSSASAVDRVAFPDQAPLWARIGSEAALDGLLATRRRRLQVRGIHLSAEAFDWNQKDALWSKICSACPNLVTLVFGLVGVEGGGQPSAGPPGGAAGLVRGHRRVISLGVSRSMMLTRDRPGGGGGGRTCCPRTPSPTCEGGRLRQKEGPSSELTVVARLGGGEHVGFRGRGLEWRHAEAMHAIVLDGDRVLYRLLRLYATYRNRPGMQGVMWGSGTGAGDILRYYVNR